MKYTCQTKHCKLAGKLFNQKGRCTSCKASLVPAQSRPGGSSQNTAADSNLDIRGDRIEPDASKDSLKLCYYKALAKAQFTDPNKGWQDIIEETRILRECYRVAFDEDAWAPALAQFYSFKRVGDTTFGCGDVLKKCGEWHKSSGKGKAQFFVIALENTERNVNGHAIYVEYVLIKSKTTFKVVDNENTGQTDRIAAKFAPSRFEIYARTEDEANRSQGHTPVVKKARLTQDVIATLDYLQKNKTLDGLQRKNTA